MGIIECCGGIDGSLVGVQNDGILLFLRFFYQVIQASEIRFVVSLTKANVAGNDLIVECIKHICPFKLSALMGHDHHVR